MKKTITLILSAVLTFGAAVPTHAAPLARKASAASENKGVSFVRPDHHSDVRPMTGIFKNVDATAANGMTRAISYPKKNRAIMSATAANRAIAANIDLRGQMIWSDLWERGQEKYGIYSLPKTAEGEPVLLYPLPKSYNGGGCDTGDGYFYGVEFLTFWDQYYVTVDKYETEGWTKVSSMSGNTGMIGFDTALDPVTGDIYGCFYNDNATGFVWGTIDYENSTRTAIADLPVQVLGVACDKDGQFYALAKDSKLYRIDKMTGVMQEIGDTGLEFKYSCGAVYNDLNNTIITTTSTDQGGLLAEVDVTDATAIVINQFAGDTEITCVYIAKPQAEDKAPAAIENFTATCENGSMDVSFSFTMPSTLFDGTPVSGESFSYKILANGETVLEDTALSGATVTRTVTLTTSGNTDFVATAGNDTGVSPRCKTSCYVGKGTPTAPTNVKLTWADGMSTITWDAVTASADGGYLNAADVTYTVIDINTEAEVASGLITTTCTVPLAEPAEGFIIVGYAVKAVYADKQSPFTNSNKIGLGTYTPPVSLDMTDADVFSTHTVEDGNNDGKTWRFSKNYATIYEYNNYESADDWLFSPEVKLEAGKVYPFSALMAPYLIKYPERVEVYIGMGANADAMTTEVLPPTDITEKATYKGLIKPTTTGIYHIGFHAISDKGMYYLQLFSYNIDEGISENVPGKVTDVSIKGNPYGEYKATVSFKAPEKNIIGGQLTGDVTVKVYRGEEMIKTVSGSAGADHSFEDTVTEYGDYDYTFVASNSEGSGLGFTVTGHVGLNKPAFPEHIAGYETSTPGNIKVFWDEVTTDSEGNILPEGFITYNLYTIDRNGYVGDKINDEPLTATDYSFDITPLEKQDFMQYGFEVCNKDVSGGLIGTGLIAVGPAYHLPALYSGKVSDKDYIFGTIDLGGVYFNYGDDSIILSADDDNSFVYMDFAEVGSKGAFLTGKYDLSVEKPALTLQIFKYSAADVNTTTISVLKDGVETLVETIYNADLVAENWNKVTVSLDDYKGQTVQFLITGENTCEVAKLAYDAIKVANNLDYDLSASITSAPVKVVADQEFNITVEIANVGALEVDSYTVDLYRNGKVVDTKTVQRKLASDETTSVTFKQTITVADESAEFKAMAVYDVDMDVSNNETEAVTVTRKLSTVPVVTGLTGENTEAGNSLSWDAIVIDEPVPAEVTEDFESGESFADEFADWTFVDVDGGENGGFKDAEIPGHPERSAYSFFVFDASAPGFGDGEYAASFAAHSGDKYLATMFQYDNSQIDDWAISPLLPGTAQTILFYAMSYNDNFRETIEIWYSTVDSSSPEDFQKIVTFENLPKEWTEYTADLPEGAKHFAIRSCATGSFMLMLDDVTFTRLDGFTGTLMGYNVYCDGIKINENLLTETTYLHTPADTESHTYAVTAVYDKGESEFSELLTIEKSGIDMVSAAAVKVFVEGRSIVVTGAEGKSVIINAVDGKTVYNAVGDARVTVTPAVYLVTVDTKTVKVIVK